VCVAKEPARIAVTGASGFIGRHLVRALRGWGCEVAALSGKGSSPQNAAWRAIDVLDVDSVAQAIEGCDAVIHLAAVTSALEIDAAPERAHRINVNGTANVAEAIRRMRVGRLVFISSGKVYTPDARQPISELERCRPSTNLGRLKLAAEQGIEERTRSDPRLSAVVLRMFNVYGPGQRRGFLIPKVLDHLGTGSIALGDLRVRRDFLYIEDAVEAVRAVLGRRDPGFSVYNVGAGRSTPVGDVVAELARLSGSPLRVTFDPEQVRSGEPREERAAIARIKELGWTVQTELEVGLTRVVEAHSTQPNAATSPERPSMAERTSA
jgi:UDP-glucose 4-epimerase